MNDLVSVVIPVRNEHDNIAACLSRLDETLRPVNHELLVVYDRPDDSTLPAIERMSPKPPALRLVQNTLGPSPSFAIRAGMAAAKGDVIAVTMADLSDPPEAILKMAEKIRAGADVVSGSRYMRGGSQTGGPLVKVVLSRAAGLSLAWVAGVRTHDATTSFRGFSRRFVDQVPLESDTGFTFGIEATVKAHLRGYAVSEVPSSWADRTAGESNFRVAKWLRAYLGWYFQVMTVPLAVWAVWVVQIGVALTRVDRGLALASVPISLVFMVWSRRVRGRMSFVDVITPLAWCVAILGSSNGSVVKWTIALVVSGVPLVVGGKMRKRP